MEQNISLDSAVNPLIALRVMSLSNEPQHDRK